MRVRIGIVSLLLLGPAAGAGEAIFNLEDVSVGELAGQMPAFAAGQRAVCTARPDPNVRAYPALKSNKPVYGSVQFGSSRQERNGALLYRFVIDESGGPGSGYDRLYVDLNGDKDLSNDAPVLPRKDTPASLRLGWDNIVEQVFFDQVGIPLPFGSEGLRRLPIMPRLLLIKGGSAMLDFVSLQARRGRIEIDGHPYDVLLGHNYGVCGWFDHPETAFYLTPHNAQQAPTAPLSATLLMTMPRLGETYYRFAATPAGDKLFVRFYDGPMGEFEVGGGLKFKTAELAVSGSLRSREALVEVRGPKCQLPAGDYYFSSLSVTHGDLTFRILENTFTDGGSKLYHSPTYAIRIRPGTPFILDFSHPPQILFAGPPKDQRVQVGERLFVQAVLVDPVLDFVICGLNQGPRKPSSAGTFVNPRSTTLPPQVTISRANGEVVARGSMDYG